MQQSDCGFRRRNERVTCVMRRKARAVGRPAHRSVRVSRARSRPPVSRVPHHHDQESVHSTRWRARSQVNPVALILNNEANARKIDEVNEELGYRLGSRAVGSATARWWGVVAASCFFVTSRLRGPWTPAFCWAGGSW